MLHRYKQFIQKFSKYFCDLKQKNAYIPSYRIIEIKQNTDDIYIVKVQLINKNITFNFKPEEILADDSLVDKFSPRDIRTLTYLGYLGINSPKYTILAQRLSQSNDKLVFALRQRGENKVMIKTANEIIKEQEILRNLNSFDAHIIGYTVASENINAEKDAKHAAQLAQKFNLKTSYTHRI